MIIENITSIEVASSAIIEQGKTYNKIIYLNDPTPIHYYYMDNLNEVGYYTPQLNKLTVHESNVVWTQEGMDQCVELT